MPLSSLVDERLMESVAKVREDINCTGRLALEVVGEAELKENLPWRLHRQVYCTPTCKYIPLLNNARIAWEILADYSKTWLAFKILPTLVLRAM